MPIARAARKLGVKNSTAKMIVKRYKESGSYFESKETRKKRLEKEKADAEKERKEQASSLLKTREAFKPINANASISFPFGISYPLSLEPNTLISPWNFPIWSTSYQF